MNRFALFALALGILGCGQQPADPPAVAQVPANVVIAAGPTDPPPGQRLADVVFTPGTTEASPLLPYGAQPKPPETPTVFEYPADLGGKAVLKAVAPDKHALTPAERFGASPKPRALPAKFRDPEALTPISHRLPPLLPAKPADVKPAAPPERVPVALGERADDVPAKPTFPIAAGITERARDVKLPPAMPTLGRPLTERVSLDDPTTEAGNAAIVTPPVKVSLAQSAFLKVSVPDPFELGEQIKPKVPAAAEPGLVPVVVNPQRVK